MILKQFYHESLDHASYLVGSEQTGRRALPDGASIILALESERPLGSVLAAPRLVKSESGIRSESC
jgi:hypothetical protein